MLLIKAKVGISKVHGLGLFAQEFIPKGKVTWKFQEGFDVVIEHEMLHQLSEPARLQVIHYAEYFPDKNVFVLSSDDDRFANHSDNPNVGPDNDGGGVIALADIKEGEEITCDYRQVIMLGFTP